MKFLARLSIALIAVSLAFPLWTSLYLIPFAQPGRAQIAAGKLHYMFSYENWVHEAGFGRLAISIIALLILFIPYRKGERWAFAGVGDFDGRVLRTRVLFRCHPQFGHLAVLSALALATIRCLKPCVGVLDRINGHGFVASWVGNVRSDLLPEKTALICRGQLSGLRAWHDFLRARGGLVDAEFVLHFF